jgi:hypothetical protein
MHKAFETDCERLRLRPGERATEEVAITVVDFAATGILDVEGLTAAALAAARRRGEFGTPGPRNTDRAA